MITPEQAILLRIILKRFLQTESVKWTEFDDNMVYLDYLEDKQLVLEAEIMLEKHCDKGARCTVQHTNPDNCYVPQILEAISYILDDYSETHRLVKNTRYMLQYYLALSATGTIITD